jgi:hypothetical protein
VGVNLESVAFDPAIFRKELSAFDVFLKSKAELSETTDIQPFFKKSKHLAAYMGTIYHKDRSQDGLDVQSGAHKSICVPISTICSAGMPYRLSSWTALRLRYEKIASGIRLMLPSLLATIVS